MPVVSSAARQFDGSLIPVVILDPDHRVVGMNTAAEMLYGAREAEVLGQSPTAFIELTYLDDTASADVIGALDERGFWHGPMVQIVADGGTHLIDATLVRVRDVELGRDLTWNFLAPAADDDRRRAILDGAMPEGRFRNLFEHLSEALLVEDLDGRILEVNEAAATLYGYRRWELIGRQAADITEAVDPQVLRERLAILREHRSNATESTGRRADGSTFPQRETVTLVGLGGRDLIFVLARDLSEQRRLEAGLSALTDLGRLQASGETVVELAEAAIELTVRMFGADRAALATFHDDQVEWLAQRRMEPFIAATHGVSPMDIPWLRQPLQTGVPELHDRTEPGHPVSPVTPIADALGIRAYAIVPLRSGDELTGWLGLIWSGPPPAEAAQTDLLASVGRSIGTALGNVRLRDSLIARQAELDESEARYRALFEEAPQPLLIQSWDRRILAANAAAAGLYGRDRDELVGAAVWAVADLDPETEARVEAELRDRRRTRFRGRGRRADGTTFPHEVDIAVATVRGEESLLVQVRDRTDEERLHGELLQAQKMEALGQLISGVAHELNNPLSAIVAFSQLMKLDERLPADVHRDADLLMQEADRTRRIVQNLLDFARQRPPERKPASIPDLIERSLELHNYALGMGRIDVQTSYADGLPPVDVDAGQIQQVLLNLLLNAIQTIRGSAQSGTIAVEATIVDDPASAPGPGFLRVTLTDDGPGVPEAIRSHLFEPFFTTREVGQGTGLGLSVSYGIIAAHGGRLWFEPGPDGGSRFVFELPASSRSTSHPEGGVAPAAAVATGGRTTGTGEAGAQAPTRRGGVVLAVDDEPSIREMLQKVLGRAGHEVEVAGSGAEALKILQILTFDVLLADHRMRGMDGVELYERAVELRPELRDRTVIMSGDTFDPSLREFATANHLRLLAKPFDVEQVMRVVDEVLSQAS